ncbi:MAG: type I 3-dehydroquinate dehydratase [Treponema sp.]|jgi:3-dehydroquinate dehydratase/shikimate dehydrogenase|nr:type I 3-dehydroquinate dehydratase [Treponema sp.]
MSGICLVLTGKTLAIDLEILERYRPYIDLVELRGDYLIPEEQPMLYHFPKMAGLPALLTMHSKENGGLFPGAEAERIALLTRAFSNTAARQPRFAYVDISCDTDAPELEKAARAGGTRIVRSFHDFNGTPSDLAARIRKLSRVGDEILKAAVTPQTLDEVAFLIQVANDFRNAEKIFISMGKRGACTRILPEQLGSAWTFAYAKDIPGAKSSAPGQLSPKELCEVYRFREIKEDTAVYGILGWPLETASSPAIFNKVFAREQMNAVYIPFPCDSPNGFMRLAELIKVKGATVTVPHKKTMLPHLARLSEEVRRTGACNTIVRGEDGWHGYNTDAPAFSGSLLRYFDREDLSGMNVTIVGAGAAAKAVAGEVSRLGGKALIVNRTLERAQELASLYRFIAAALEAGVENLIAGYSDLIINATSAGMEPAIENDPLEMYTFKGHEKVMDIIYKPEQTRFLRRAARAGCTTLNGYDMFIRQTRYQFKHFFGKEYPLV